MKFASDKESIRGFKMNSSLKIKKKSRNDSNSICFNSYLRRFEGRYLILEMAPESSVEERKMMQKRKESQQSLVKDDFCYILLNFILPRLVGHCEE